MIRESEMNVDEPLGGRYRQKWVWIHITFFVWQIT